jgi:hypothetical protein
VQERILKKAVLAAIVPVSGSLLGASMASGQILFSNTFDALASSATDPTPNVIWLGARNYNPPAEDFAFDYGGPTPTADHSVSFTTAEDATGNGGGSIKLSWNFSASDGSESAAFTTDIFPSAETVNTVSFDLMVDPSSTLGGYSRYAYFQVINRDENYGEDGSFIATNLSGPTGVWQQFTGTVPAGLSVRGLTFQFYQNVPGDDITGPETVYIDNLVLSATPVPEPVSLGLLALGAPALMMRRRRAKV